MQKRGFLTSHILPFRSVKRLEEAGSRNTSLKGSKNRQEKWSLAERTRAQFLETAWKQAKKITIARKVSARETHVRVSRRKIQQTIKKYRADKSQLPQHALESALFVKLIFHLTFEPILVEYLPTPARPFHKEIGINYKRPLNGS